MMRAMKKLIGVMLAIMLAAAMAVPAMAADTVVTTTIKVIGGAKGAEYKAYRILNVTTAEVTNTDGKKELIYAYTLNSKYTGVLEEVTELQGEKEIIGKIESYKDKDDEVRAFADSVYKKIVEKKLKHDETATAEQEATGEKEYYAEFTDIPQGYYLIAETKSGDAPDEYSLVMLGTAGQHEVSIETKEEAPHVDKKVKENGSNDAWGDTAQYSVGDDVPFRLNGYVSGKYSSYETYYFAFIDELSQGLALNEASIRVSLKVGDSLEAFDKDTDYKVHIEDNKQTFSIIFENLTKTSLNEKISNNSKIIVDYTAKLTDDAVIGAEGNDNKVKLEFSNNPYNSEDHGETPEEIVKVFTFKVIVKKIDQNNQALEGAGFTLYKQSTDDSWEELGDEITGGTEFSFDRLEAGKYKLVETTVPNGYNQAEDLFFEIVAELNDDPNAESPYILVIKDKNGNTISGDDVENPTFTIDLGAGSATTTVQNKPGTLLPETGGTGTKLLYLLGGALVVGAGALLVWKKRGDQE